MVREFCLAGPLSLALLCHGCETVGGSVATGAAAGAGLGAGAGALADPGPNGEGRIKNVVIGTAAGAALGAGAGYLSHNMLKDKEDEAYEKGKADEQKTIGEQTGGNGEPVLLPPKIETRFVGEQVRGKTFIPAHFEYIIVEPARWSH